MLVVSSSLAINFFWQCEKKEKILLAADERVSTLRDAVADRLEEDYKLDKAADVALYLNGVQLDDESQQLQSVGIGVGSVVVAVSVAVAEAVNERKKIRSTKEVFESLKLSGGSDAKAQELALKNSRPFDLCCDVLDLGELGAGWPILFQFIVLLIVLLIGLFLVHMPAMRLYASGNQIRKWPVVPENLYLSSSMLTAGNLGPAGSSSLVPGWVALLCGLIMLIAATMMSRKIGVIKKAVDVTEVDASDFALFVEGLPSDVVSEKEVADWMEVNLREDETTEIVKVVFGYDVNEFRRLHKEFVETRKQIGESTDARAKGTLEARYKELNGILTNEENLYSTLGGSGTAVVVLRYQTDHRQALQEWNTCLERMARTFNFQCLSSKPMFEHDSEDVMLTITRADQPSDIIWENLSVSLADKCRARGKVWGMLFGVFLIAFAFILGGRVLQKRFHTESYAQVIAGVAIGLSTMAVFVFSNKWIDAERYETKTRRDVSLMVKFSLMYAMNYNLALLLASFPMEKYWYGKKGLFGTIFILQIATSIMYPVFYATGCKECFGSCIKTLLSAAAQGGNPSQAKMNKLHAPPEIDPARIYSQILKVYFIGLFYMPVMPLGGLVCGLGLIAYYWSFKYYLLRKCQRPYRQSEVLGYVAVKCVFAGTAAYAFAQWFFLSHSLTFEGADFCRNVMWILMIASVVMMIAPRQVYQYLLCTCLCFPIGEEEIDGDIDYYDVQKAWAKHQKYHTANAVYLWMENVYSQKSKHFGDKFVPPWDFQTGNLPKPGKAAEAPGVATAGPMPGTLAGKRAEKVEDEDDDADGMEAPSESAALGGADPAELALEEMKYKLDLAALGALPAGAGDASDDGALSEGEDEDDVEAPLAGSAASSAGGLRPGMSAAVSGLESSAGNKYNGTTCTVVAKDEATGKWTCEMMDGKKANLPESKLTAEPVFAAGAVVFLEGLKDAPQYNGTKATIISYERSKKGYLVSLFTGVKACVKPWNVSHVGR